MADPKYNAFDLRQQIQEAVTNGDCDESLNSACEFLGIPKSSVREVLMKEFGTADIPELLGLNPESISPPVVKPGKSEEASEDLTKGQFRILTAKTDGAIKTHFDLMRSHQIDAKDWIIASPIHRAWTVPMKLRVIETRDTKGDPVITNKAAQLQQHYVGVKLLPRHPEPVEPIITPVVMNYNRMNSRKQKKGKVKRDLIVGDAQMGFLRQPNTGELVPFHDRRVLWLILQLLDKYDFDNLIFAGDWADFAEFSTHWKPEPEYYFTTQPTVIEMAYWMAAFREVHRGKMIYLEGNHDQRIVSMIKERMPGAYGLRPADALELPPIYSPVHLFGLQNVGCEYLDGYPNNNYRLSDGLVVTHGDKAKATAGATAAAHLQRRAFSVVFFHSHRQEQVSTSIETTNGKITIQATNPGCCSHVDGRVPGEKADISRQQGLAIVERTQNKESVFTVPIEEGFMVYAGEEYQAPANIDTRMDKFVLAELKKITP